MRGPWWLAYLVAAACVETTSAPLPATEHLRFVLRVDGSGRVIAEPRGPYGPDEKLNLEVTLLEGETLVLLELDEEGVRRTFPSYAPRGLDEVSLVTSRPEVEQCLEPGGFLEDDARLLVPLSGLGEAVRASVLAGASPVGPIETPSGLALRFEAKVCGRGSKIRLKPFTRRIQLWNRGEDGVGRIGELLAIDAETLLGVGLRGLVTLRRGMDVDVETDVVRIEGLLPPPTLGVEWELVGGAITQRAGPDGMKDVIVVAAALRDRGLPTYESEVGGASLHFKVDSVGRVRFQSSALFQPSAPNERQSLARVLIGPSGRTVMVGRNLVVTSTVPGGTLNPQVVSQFDANWVLPLNEDGAPHIMGDSAGQIFEGDPFGTIESSRIYEVANVADVRLHGATRLFDENSSVLAVGSDGRAWRRVARGDWRPYALDFPATAAACAGSAGACGRRPAGAFPNRALGLRGNLGALIGTRTCAGLFWRTPLDGCVHAIPVAGEEVTIAGSQGNVAALLDFEGHLYATAGSSYLYEVEVELEP